MHSSVTPTQRYTTTIQPLSTSRTFVTHQQPLPLVPSSWQLLTLLSVCGFPSCGQAA